MGRNVTDYLLYRWRYILGYGVVCLIILALLLVTGLFIPGGLSVAETHFVTQSSAISWHGFQPDMVINLPYHLLQKASLTIFGVSTYSIKFPSVFLGILSGIGMLLLLRTWFQRNVAALTTILIITTGQFLYVAQSGTASIVYIFLPVWLLVAALYVSRHVRFSLIWKIVLFSCAALSLYTPLSIYILLAIGSAAALHPHLRYLIRHMRRYKVIIALSCALVLLIPLIVSLVRQPHLSLSLLGVPTTPPDILANVITLIKQYFDILSPSSGTLLTPIYGLGALILILLGILRLVTTKYTARSYITAAWVILLLPIIIIDPSYTTVTFVPILLLMAFGVNSLLSSWYHLFPKNPYARVAGLIPLIVLIGGMVHAGVSRYMYNYQYDPAVVANFSDDLHLLNNSLRGLNGKTAVVVSPDEAPFYNVVAKHRRDLTVDTQLPTTPASTIIVSHDARVQTANLVPYRIVTDGMSTNADRFYIYKTDQK